MNYRKEFARIERQISHWDAIKKAAEAELQRLYAEERKLRDDAGQGPRDDCPPDVAEAMADLRKFRPRTRM